MSEKKSVHHRKGCELVDKAAVSKYRPFPQIDSPQGDFDFVLLITAQFKANDEEAKRIIIGYAIVYEGDEVEISKLVFSQKMRIKRTTYLMDHLLYDAISKSLEVLVARFESFIWFCCRKTGNDKCPVVLALDSIKETTLFTDTKFKIFVRPSNSKASQYIKTIPSVFWGDLAHRSCFYKPPVPDSSTKEPKKTMTQEKMPHGESKMYHENSKLQYEEEIKKTEPTTEREDEDREEWKDEDEASDKECCVCKEKEAFEIGLGLDFLLCSECCSIVELCGECEGLTYDTDVSCEQRQKIMEAYVAYGKKHTEQRNKICEEGRLYFLHLDLDKIEWEMRECCVCGMRKANPLTDKDEMKDILVCSQCSFQIEVCDKCGDITYDTFLFYEHQEKLKEAFKSRKYKVKSQGNTTLEGEAGNHYCDTKDATYCSSCVNDELLCIEDNCEDCKKQKNKNIGRPKPKRKAEAVAPVRKKATSKMRHPSSYI